MSDEELGNEETVYNFPINTEDIEHHPWGRCHIHDNGKGFKVYIDGIEVFKYEHGKQAMYFGKGVNFHVGEKKYTRC